MRKWMTPVLLVFLLGTFLSTTSCNRSGCPAEIQAKKVKKRKKLGKDKTTNLFSKKMRKNVKSPKF
jgi:hypothetical protein